MDNVSAVLRDLDKAKARIRELEAANAKQSEWLVKATNVIEWKSLYAKAEMGWYALALVDEILGRDYRDPVDAHHGKRWYERSTSTVEGDEK